MTRNEAVIVAHGSPSDPLPQEHAMERLAARVGSLCPGWTVRGATLALHGSLEAALEGLTCPWVYPFFMADGYFVGEVIPKRLKDRAAPLRLMPAFGTDPGLPGLVSASAFEAARAAGKEPRESDLLLAAHGSRVSPASRRATEALVESLRKCSPFRTVAAGFIEEAPHIEDVARRLGDAICVPLFTLRAGHVTEDVPEALRRANFGGTLLDPVGLHHRVPGMIAAALARQPDMVPA